MTYETAITQAQFYIERKRFEEAEKTLRLFLAESPNEVEALNLLALVLQEREQPKEALQTIQSALGIQPDNDRLYYHYGYILTNQGKYKDAEKQVGEAIRINPKDANYFGLMAQLRVIQKDFKGALKYAEEGLAVDPESVYCLNMKSTAQVKMGNESRAFEPMEEALKREPENAVTHAVYGWGLLEKNQNKQALEHFREALRLDPNLEMAQSGMLQALKARYWFYRIFLQFFFWMGKQNSRIQWGIIILIFLGTRFIREWADKNEELRPYLMTIWSVLILFALLTWIIGPLSNLLLRLNPYGRYLLGKKEKQASNFVGIALGIGLISAAVYFGTSLPAAMAGIYFGITMMLPLGSMFSPSQKGKRQFLIGYAAVMALSGILGLIHISMLGKLESIFIPVYVLLFVAYTWIANIVNR